MCKREQRVRVHIVHSDGHETAVLPLSATAKRTPTKVLAVLDERHGTVWKSCTDALQNRAPPLRGVPKNFPW